jgi:hypothetical protein
MSIPIDDETFPAEHQRAEDETKQGNPGQPQSDFEDPPEGPSDEPSEGADRTSA